MFSMKQKIYIYIRVSQKTNNAFSGLNEPIEKIDQHGSIFSLVFSGVAE